MDNGKNIYVHRMKNMRLQDVMIYGLKNSDVSGEKSGNHSQQNDATHAKLSDGKKKTKSHLCDHTLHQLHASKFQCA